MQSSAIKFLATYKGEHPFLLSVQERMLSGKSLTEKQEAAVLKFMQPRAEKTPKDFSLSRGDVIEVSNWMAKKLAEKLSIRYIFRNLTIAEFTAETDKAIAARIEFYHKPAVNCHICGRFLDNPESRALGIGPICAEKIGVSNYRDSLSFIKEHCREVGTLGPVWIPKSQDGQVL